MKIIILDKEGIKEFIPLNSEESNDETFISSIKYELDKLSPPITNSSKIDLLTITDLINLFQTTRPTIYSWIEKHLLFPIRMGGRVYFDKKDILDLMEKKRNPSTQNIKVDDIKKLF